VTGSSTVCAVGAAGFLAAAALATSVQPSSAAFHNRNGKIAFGGTSNAVFNAPPTAVWSMTSSGTDRHRLTPRGVVSGSPAFSPDGKQIVYVRSHCNDSSCDSAELWLMDTSGDHQRELTLTTDVFEAEPAWSPNGRRIAYTAAYPGGEESGGIWVKSTNGSRPRQLTQTGHSASWSPDGKRIAYVVKNHIYVIRVTGGRVHNLTPGHVYARDPDWSPDGRRIVFSSDDDLWVMRADGGHQHSITSTVSFNEMQPTWSPDGGWIAYIRAGADKTGAPSFPIDLVRPDGKNRHRITPTSVLDGSPTWQRR
jgi:TolB protein